MTDLEAITESLEHWRDNLQLLVAGEVVIPRDGDDCALCRKHSDFLLTPDECCQKCSFMAVYETRCARYWVLTDPEYPQITRILAAANLIAQLFTMQQEYDKNGIVKTPPWCSFLPNE